MDNYIPKLSIIVPVYNVKNYLNKCIESILNQTFKNFEVILIDDGSNDGSEDICDNFAEKDSRVKVIHKENTGAADSRNLGISKARGEYLGFVDSDDYIETDMYEFLYNMIKKYNSDISICGLVHEYNDKSFNPYPKEIEENLTGIEALKTALIGNKFSVNIYNKIFKRKLFTNLKFPQLKFAEDAYAVIRLLYKSSTVSYNTKPKYHWVRHPESITTSSFTPKNWEVVTVYSDNLDFINKHCPDLIKEAICRYYLAYFWIIDQMAVSFKEIPKPDFKRAKKVLTNGYFKIISNPYFTLKRKIAATVLILNWNLYKKIVKASRPKLLG